MFNVKIRCWQNVLNPYCEWMTIICWLSCMLFYIVCKLDTFSRTQVTQWVRYLDYLATHTSLSPIRRGFAPGFVNYKKGCTRLAAASDKVYQLLAHGRWFSSGTPASSTTKTGRHDIAEILLKVALKHQKSIKNQINTSWNISNKTCLVFLVRCLFHSRIYNTKWNKYLLVIKHYIIVIMQYVNTKNYC